MSPSTKTPPTPPCFAEAGLDISRIGLGCMGMSGSYGPAVDQDSITLIRHAVDQGCNFIDTADLYGAGHNEELVGRALKGLRSRVFLATKFGRIAGAVDRMVDGRPEYVQAACERSLKRLGTEVIDLYYLHRLDPQVPIEDTMGAMQRLVEQGKVRYLGLSEVTVETLHRARTIHPIAAVQSELSLWWTSPRQAMVPYCEEHGIAFVAFSPLGRGMLSGKLQSTESFQKDDFRRNVPRFQPGAFEKNLHFVQELEALANEKGVTTSQLCLAWLLHESRNVYTIPGTRRRKYFDENWGARALKLSAADRERIDQLLENTEIQGERYSTQYKRLVS